MANPVSLPKTPLSDRTFLGHPLGLYVLFFTEMWERFSYYGMRALLITYMVTYFRWSQSHASEVYKWYTTLVYVTPIIGGFLADRYLGNRMAVFIGAILMAIGHFLMAFEAHTIFYAALVFLIIGNGFFKPNMTTQVGRLYPPNDRRRDGAYTIFYMGINLGAFLSPLACGWLQENTKGGFHAGFALAGIGMLLGLLTYMFGQSLLKEYQADPTKTRDQSGIMTEEEAANSPSVLGSYQNLIPLAMWVGAGLLLAMGVYGGIQNGVKGAAPGVVSGIALCAIAWIAGSVKNALRDRVTTIVVIGLFAIFFWAAFEQQGNALNLWADKVTNRYLTQAPPEPTVYREAAQIFPDPDDAVGGKEPTFMESMGQSLSRFREIFELKERGQADKEGSVINPVPTAWFQSINALAIFLMAPLFAWVWVKVDISIPAKMVLGLSFMGISFLIMVFGATAENAVRTVELKGNLPAVITLDSEGHIMLKHGGEEIKAHAGRLTIQKGKVECFGVFSDLERDELSLLTAPESFKKEMEAASKALKDQKSKGLPRKYELSIPADVRGFDLGYGGFHPKGVVHDKQANKLVITQVLEDKDEKALLVCAADPDFRATLDNLMVTTAPLRVSSQWLLWCYIFATMGELCLSPVGQSMTSKLSPKKFATMLMGVWLLVNAFGSFGAGAMGELYGLIPPVGYFGYMTLALFIAAGLLFLLVPRLTKMMHGVR